MCLRGPQQQRRVYALVVQRVVAKTGEVVVGGEVGWRGRCTDGCPLRTAAHSATQLAATNAIVRSRADFVTTPMRYPRKSPAEDCVAIIPPDGSARIGVIA